MKNLLEKKKSQTSSHVDIDAVIESKPQKTQETGSFSKIAISKVDTPVHRKKKWGIIVLTLVFVLVGLGSVILLFGVLPAQATLSKAKELAAVGKELGAALKNQNLEEAKNKLPQTRAKLIETQNEWNKAVLLKVTPVINQYHKDVIHGLAAAGFGLDALETSIVTIEPYADLLGFKGESSFVAGSADERLQFAVKTLDKVTPKIAEIGTSIGKIKNEIDAIDPQRYPETFAGKPVRPRLIEAKQLVENTTGLFLNAQPLLEVLPQLLGEPTVKRYLVLFQNDKELRPTGGFITAYAIFRIEHGKFIVEKSDDIYELDDQIKTKKQAPPEILTYHKGVYYFNIRDSNLSPDFAVSMKQFMELYPNKWDFDGILAVDTHVLVEAIKILGDFSVKGRTFGAEIDPRCDCPKVIYELEDYSTRPVAYVRETRKDVLGDLLLQIMKKALGVSPSQYWGRLFQMALSEIDQKHILANMMDEKAQKGIESLNMGGRIADGTAILGYKDGQNWDYLHINDANMAGAKSNLFVSHTIKQEYNIEGDGSITKTITIDYKNPAPPSDCNLERGGLCLNGLLRDWIRIYVPKGSTLIESKGSQSPKDDNSDDLKTREELGKTVFEGFLTVRPQGSAQLTLTYKLPFKKNGKLMSLYQKQPGTQGHEYSVLVGGKQKEKFSLTTDKVVTLP